MAPELLADFLYDGLLLLFWLAAPALAAALAAGFLSSLVQATMQVQEPALAFVPKLLAVGATLVVAGAALRDRWLAFARDLFAALS